MNTLTAPQLESFGGLRLFAKKLLYKCDISTNFQSGCLKAEGHLRVGPLQSKVSLISKFDEKGLWKSYELEAPSMKFWQEYKRIENSPSIAFRSSKSTETDVLPPQDSFFLDPLCSLVLLYQWVECDDDVSKEIRTFSGHRWTALEVNGGNVVRKGKTFAKIVKGATTTLQIPSIKAEVQILESRHQSR